MTASPAMKYSAEIGVFQRREESFKHIIYEVLHLNFNHKDMEV
jgi:hypothetical protein